MARIGRPVPARSLTADDVWQRVRDYAVRAKRHGWRIPTLTRGVANEITDIKNGSFGRRSAEGRTNVSRVTRGQVRKVWNAIKKPGGTRVPPGILYFAPAVLVKALPGAVRFSDGVLALVDDAVVAHRRKKRVREAQVRRSGRAGGESPEHKTLKEFVFRRPDVALAKLSGGPFVPLETEYLFDTGDEVDVALRDAKGRAVLVEVKPDTRPDDRAPWGQAAKYRTLWSFFEEEPERTVRPVVVAPRIDSRLAKRMRKAHRIEWLVVPLPKIMKRRRVAPGRGH